MKRLMQSAIKILVILTVILIHTLLAEALVRYETFGVGGFSEKLLESIPIPNQQIISDRLENCRIIKPLIPNRSLYYKAEVFETNSIGLRDVEYNITKDEGVFRILILGNSVSLGVGVRINETYHSIVEEKLNQRPGGKRYEILNLGCGPANLSKNINDINETTYYNPDMLIISDSHTNINSLNQTQIDRLKQYQKNYGVPVILVSQNFGIKKNKDFGEIMTVSLNVTKINVWELIYPADSHPDKYVHQKYAKRLYDYLIENWEKIENTSNPAGKPNVPEEVLERIENEPMIYNKFKPKNSFWKSYYLEKIQNKTAAILN